MNDPYPWLMFEPPLPEPEARKRFADKFGYEPEQCFITFGRIQLVGPKNRSNAPEAALLTGAPGGRVDHHSQPEESHEHDGGVERAGDTGI